MKSVYFYALDIKEKGTDVLQPITSFKNIIEKIIEPIKEENNYYSIDISSPDDSMKTFVDIFDYKEDYFFARLSKQRPTNSVVGRNYETLKTEPVMGNYPDNIKGIEKYSFAYINYKTLIVGIATSQYSPAETAIANLIKQKSNFYVEAKAIANRNGIDSIFQHQKPVISSFTLDIPNPDPALLESFGFTDNEIHDIFANNIQAKISISPAHGKILTSDNNVPTLVDKIRNLKQKAALSGATIKARSATTNAREYNLYDEIFKYDINIPTSHIKDGHSISLSEAELLATARIKLIEAYNANYDIIVQIANRG